MFLHFGGSLQKVNILFIAGFTYFPTTKLINDEKLQIHRKRTGARSGCDDLRRCYGLNREYRRTFSLPWLVSLFFSYSLTKIMSSTDLCSQ